MELNEIYDQLLASSNYKNQQKLLHKSFHDLNPQDVDTLAERLKEQVVQLLLSDTQAAIKLSDLILYLAELSKSDLHRALGLRAKAQAVMLGEGEYQQALDLYDEAIEIYQNLGDQVGEARVNVTRIWALANLGFYDQAVEEAENAISILKERSYWRSLATLQNNLATIHNRAGKSKLALDMHTEAREAFIQLGEEGEQSLASSELNRAWDFYELAQYENSIQANQKALTWAKKFEQSTVIARANHNMGVTYLRLGRNNEALHLFERAREIHLSNEQPHEAALCELSSLDCLSELRRFDDILRICQDIIPLFTDKGMRLEAAEAIQSQALALSKLNLYREAIDALQKSRRIFIEDGNKLWITLTDLETAALLHSLGDFDGCLTASQKCIADFEELNHRVEATIARLVAARAACELGQNELADHLSQEARKVADEREIPFLIYQSNKVLGQLALQQGNIPDALSHYDDSISALEKLSGNVMTEFHAEFLEDKQSVFDAAVDLCIQTNQVELSLTYAERAKSRALLKILAFRPDLGIQAQDKKDEPLVAEITDLRLERERLLNYANEHKFDLEIEQHQEQIAKVEKTVTALWHKLLVRNAAYARQASLWQVQVEDARPYLDDGVLLLEYYLIGEDLVVFLVSHAEEVRCHRLSAVRSRVERYLQLFNLNLRAVTQSASTNTVELIANAQALLKQLNQLLIEPLSVDLAEYKQLIIVPHGFLHYLPFHALYDGKSYLIERYPISYLPGSSFLHYYRKMSTSNKGILAVGHSYQGRIPNAVLEADKIAHIFQADPLLEEEATLERLQALVADKQMLHLACHGEFHADNPLFSGLALDNGWLTTLDVFNLRLNASLVTLSACETGRSVVSGGDELLGIMRAFFAAGAATLLLSHWAVEDRSTLLLIENFYHHLMAGKTKVEALQLAQKHLLAYHEGSDALDQNEPRHYSHPYSWAPFFLTGDYGGL